MPAPARCPQPHRETGSRHARPTRRPRVPVYVGVVALAFAACDRRAEPAPVWPAGTALVFDGTPISADEIDRVADVFALMAPQNSVAETRRLALTNVLFPLHAARGIDAARRTATLEFAREHARSVRAGAVSTGALLGPVETERAGGARAVGLEAWNFALGAEVGAWSELLETPGAFELVQLKERGKQNTPAALEVRVGVFVYPYLDETNPRAAIDAALDRAKLVIVDPAWREFVPTAWQYRLKANLP